MIQIKTIVVNINQLTSFLSWKITNAIFPLPSLIPFFYNRTSISAKCRRKYIHPCDFKTNHRRLKNVFNVVHEQVDNIWVRKLKKYQRKWLLKNLIFFFFCDPWFVYLRALSVHPPVGIVRHDFAYPSGEQQVGTMIYSCVYYYRPALIVRRVNFVRRHATLASK